MTDYERRFRRSLKITLRHLGWRKGSLTETQSGALLATQHGAKFDKFVIVCERRYVVAMNHLGYMIMRSSLPFSTLLQLEASIANEEHIGLLASSIVDSRDVTTMSANHLQIALLVRLFRCCT